MSTLNLDRIAKMKAELEKRMSGSSKNSTRVLFWVPKEKENRIRVMPSWTQDENSPYYGIFFREVHQHWNVYESQVAPFICAKNTPGLEDDCPVCNFVDTLRADKTNLDSQELVKKIRSKVAFMLNIVDLKNPTYTKTDVEKFRESRNDDIEVPFKVGDPKIQVYAAGQMVFNAILGFINENKVDITDLEEGHDITITKTGSGLQTKYEVHPKIKPSVSNVTDVSMIPDLEKVGFVVDSDKLRQLLAENHGSSYPALMSGSSRAIASRSSVVTTEEDIMDTEDDDDIDDLEAELKRAIRK